MGECSAIRLQGQTPAITELNNLAISWEKSIVTAFLAFFPFWKWKNKCFSLWRQRKKESCWLSMSGKLFLSHLICFPNILEQ